MVKMYNPVLTRPQLEKELSKLRKLNYNAFRWWRMYDVKSPKLHHRCPLIDRIKNGDFDYSPFTNHQYPLLNSLPSPPQPAGCVTATPLLLLLFNPDCFGIKFRLRRNRTKRGGLCSYW